MRFILETTRCVGYERVSHKKAQKAQNNIGLVFVFICASLNVRFSRLVNSLCFLCLVVAKPSVANWVIGDKRG